MAGERQALMGSDWNRLAKRVRELYKARRKFSPHPEGWVDDDLNAKCWAMAIAEEGRR